MHSPSVPKVVLANSFQVNFKAAGNDDGPCLV